MIAHTGIIHQFLFPGIIWRMTSPGVYLTFDDGPHPTATAAVLDVLQSFHIPATFFVTGSNIEANSSLLRRTAAEGHSIGIHGFHHRRRDALTRESVRKEILLTSGLCRKYDVEPRNIYRPPFGFFMRATIAVAQSLNVRIVLWSTLTGDFRQWTDERIVRVATRRLNGGAILVFHDNDSTATRIRSYLPRCIETIAARGYSFQKIT
jgi:peptidoglycan/xylan/chitin deacetylase (PgdA/CDA1 family)